MRALTKRLGALEQASGVKEGWDSTKPCHRIILGERQSHAEALAEHRAKYPEMEIAPNHNVIWRRIVSPAFDEAGALIPKEPPKGGMGKGPTLGEVMEALKEQGIYRESGR